MSHWHTECAVKYSTRRGCGSGVRQHFRRPDSGGKSILYSGLGGEENKTITHRRRRGPGRRAGRTPVTPRAFSGADMSYAGFLEVVALKKKKKHM